MDEQQNKMTPSDKTVEAVARALFESRYSNLTWDGLMVGNHFPYENADYWRIQAKAAIAAIHEQETNPANAEGYYLPKGHPDHPFTSSEISAVDEVRCRILDISELTDVFDQEDSEGNYLIITKILNAILPYLRTTEPGLTLTTTDGYRVEGGLMMEGPVKSDEQPVECVQLRQDIWDDVFETMSYITNESVNVQAGRLLEKIMKHIAGQSVSGSKPEDYYPLEKMPIKHGGGLPERESSEQDEVSDLLEKIRQLDDALFEWLKFENLFYNGKSQIMGQHLDETKMCMKLAGVKTQLARSIIEPPKSNDIEGGQS